MDLPRSFDVWWVEQHGRPPETARERSTFNDSVLGWIEGMECAELIVGCMKISKKLSESSRVRFWNVCAESIIESMGARSDTEAENVRSTLRNFALFIDMEFGDLKVDDDALLSIGKGREYGSGIGKMMSKFRELESGDGKRTNKDYLICTMLGCMSSICDYIANSEPSMKSMIPAINQACMKRYNWLKDPLGKGSALRVVE